MNASRLLFEGLEDRILLNGAAGIVAATQITYNNNGSEQAGNDVVFTLPKFDDQGGTLELERVTIQSTVTADTGARNVQNPGPFDGTLDELTFTLNVTTTVDVAAGTNYVFGPSPLSNSLMNVPMAAGQVRSVTIGGETTGILETIVGVGAPGMSDFISAPGDTTIDITTVSGTTVTLVTTGFTANTWTDPVVNYTVTATVIYEYTEGGGGTDEMYFDAELPAYEAFQPRFPRFQPFYSGTAQPGSTLSIDILGAGGEVLGSTSTMADASGNWTANFYNTYLRTDQPHIVSIRQLHTGYTPLEGSGFNLRRYFSPALLGGAYASEVLTVDNVLGARSASVLLAALHSASVHPITLGLAPYQYELLADSPVP